MVHPGAATGFNVLLITLDTTRPDHLGCYGYKAIETPAIDSLLDHGVRFDDAVASAPLTLPSHASLFTGLHPPTLGVRDNGSYRLGPEYTTLAEVLRNQGYETAAFVAAFILDRRYGLDQGFNVYDFRISETGRKGTETLLNERGADDVTNSAIRWLDQRARSGTAAPFFAWGHYYDPHHPYKSPLADLERFRDKLPYDAEVAFVDMHFKRLLDTVDKHNLRARTLIVVVSDHGESLREHGEPNHGIFIYEATIRSAWLLSNPVLFDRPYRVDDRVVSLVDAFPTLLELLGLPLPSRGDGQSLLSVKPDPDRAVYIESYYPREKLRCSTLCGLRRHTDKYILAPTPEYYDLRKDPREAKNLYATAPPVLPQRLAELLRNWDQTGGARSGARTMSAEEEARLRSLGYAGTSHGT
ncbi:MAG: sulfatase [Planctomycetota bacterium]